MYLVMTETFENIFHKRYVGGVGEVKEKPLPRQVEVPLRARTYEDVLAEYRWYMRDKTAELPDEIMEELVKQGMVQQ